VSAHHPLHHTLTTCSFFLACSPPHPSHCKSTQGQRPPPLSASLSRYTSRTPQMTIICDSQEVLVSAHHPSHASHA
jgi:hypothetical protein